MNFKGKSCLVKKGERFDLLVGKKIGISQVQFLENISQRKANIQTSKDQTSYCFALFFNKYL